MDRLLKGFCALALLLSTVPLFSSPAAADAGAEHDFLARLNGLRVSRGLSPLAADARLTDVARAWSGRMAAAGVMSDNPSLSSQAPAGWQKLGENVGYGPTVAGLHDALVASAPHYANMVDPAFNATGVGVVVAGSTIWVTQVFMRTSGNIVTAAVAPVAGTLTSGTEWYRLAGSGGEVHSFGSAAGLPAVATRAPMVAMAAKPGGAGTWLAAADGAVFALGDAGFFGSMAGRSLTQPIVGMAATPSGKGYWLVARDGGIFAFGDAAFLGSAGGRTLGSTVTAMAAGG